MLIHDDGDAPCRDCGERPKLRTCSECGSEGRIIDCGHMDQPRPIAAGRVDGSRLWEDYCEDCAALVEGRIIDWNDDMDHVQSASTLREQLARGEAPNGVYGDAQGARSFADAESELLRGLAERGEWRQVWAGPGAPSWTIITVEGK